MNNYRLITTIASAITLLLLSTEISIDVSGDAPARNVAFAADDHLEEDTAEMTRHAQDKPTDENHNSHEDVDGHEDEDRIHLAPERMEALDITLGRVRRGSVKSTLSFPAETALDPDADVHLVPRIPGIAQEIEVGLGDPVVKGQLLAVLESVDLGTNKSNLLARQAEFELAQQTLVREKRLWEEKISAEQDYLVAKQSFRNAQIKLDIARQALYALGLSSEEVQGLSRAKTTNLTRYEVRAPIDGTILSRHLSRGESVDTENTIFRLANLDSIWVLGRVTERDIRRLELGQEATLQLEAYPGEAFSGKIDYIGNMIDPDSRTIDVRVVLENPEGHIRAGMFGQLLVFLNTHDHETTLLVPNDALQRSARGAIVYRSDELGTFEPVSVAVLHQSDTMTEIQGPLKENDQVAVGDLFVLKSEAEKEAMGGGHSH